MKVNYDLQTDILTVILKDNVAVAEGDEDKRGVILDYDAKGELLSWRSSMPPAASAKRAQLSFRWRRRKGGIPAGVTRRT